MDNSRQQKIGRQLQRDLGELFLRELAHLAGGAMVTVMSVRISPDLSYARVWLSIFPFERHDEVMKNLEANSKLIRGLLGTKVKGQLRIVPELGFFLDDSFEYIDRIDDLLKK